MTKLHLGVLGMSAGNGHPYSWSAIFNGYDRQVMSTCPFPSIPEYLSLRDFPFDAIPDAAVSHVWTQDRDLSEHIARAALIGSVVNRAEDMIGSVDGILLARDDSENHLDLARPFLKAGLPIFIDKPIATSANGLDQLLALEQYCGQIFTCSALRFAPELQVTRQDREQLGRIRHIDALAVKDWKRYAVHAIEPAIATLGDPGEIRTSQVFRNDRVQTVQVAWESGVTASFTSLGSLPGPISMALFGERGFKIYSFGQPFLAFKAALEAFIHSVRQRKRVIPMKHTKAVVSVVEKGMN